MPVRRADRRNSNDDNERNYPRSRQQEPTSYHELKQQRDNARADRTQLQQEKVQFQQQLQTLQQTIDEQNEHVTQNQQLYLDEQQKYQQTLCLYNAEKENSAELLTQVEQADIQRIKYQTLYREKEESAKKNYQLYLDEQQKYQQTLCLYNDEKVRSAELLTKYEEADAQRVQYLTLYDENQGLLKSERSSKASIKGWETRRKRENERLKQEIADMVILLRESLTSKEEAVNNLYQLAERMDRIQNLVESVEEESINTPVGLLQKLRRIWLAIQDILAE
jgi:hypothetical protein